MPIGLPSHLSYCELDGRLIALDLRRDRYFEIGGSAAAALRQAQHAAVDPGSRDRAALIAAGLITDQAARGPLAPTNCTVPCGPLLSSGVRRSARPLDIMTVGAALIAVRRKLKRGRLEGLIDDLRTRKANRPVRRGTASLAELVERFEAARRWLPIAPQCLLDSVVLSRFLSARGHTAVLVAGVKIDPFGAHCWLQTGSAVLNGDADDAAAFQPILVV